ncbi:Uncharacterized protein Rs2_38507 [Raphanus sativus]|nr:Uncharacterized protein Rs2_38507 [Raphanus sativus]
MFDQMAGPSSPSGIRLRLSPLPFTPLTSPVKSSDSGLGFASHATTPNAFKAQLRPTRHHASDLLLLLWRYKQDMAAGDPIVDLTTTKDPPAHVPSSLENLLAKELFSSPLIPALDLITPLPERECELFDQVLKSNINVTPSDLSF